MLREHAVHCPPKAPTHPALHTQAVAATDATGERELEAHLVHALLMPWIQLVQQRQQGRLCMLHC